MHGLWQSTVPSRFLDDLPEDHVEVSEPASYGGYGAGGMGGYGASRFDTMEPFNSAYRTPGWQRAQANREAADPRKRVEREPVTIEGELVARSVIGGDGALLARRPRVPPEIRRRARWRRWTATSSRWISTRPGRSAWWISFVEAA